MLAEILERNRTGSPLVDCISNYVTANRLRPPVVFDLVGVGGSALRKEAAQQLLDTVHISVILGSASYRNYIIGAMFRLQGTAPEEGANYEIL